MTEQHEFERFMKDHQDMVYSVAVRLVANDADALDIAQETFLRAYDRFEALRQSPTASGWLRTVARNLSLNHLSRYRARWTFFSELFSHDDDRSEGVDLPAPDTRQEQLDGEHRRAIVEEALNALPQKQRVPLVLYHFEEMSYEEIARQLGVSLSQVKVTIHRARERLRDRLQHVEKRFEPGGGLSRHLTRMQLQL